jgi:hypothetical protein
MRILFALIALALAACTPTVISPQKYEGWSDAYVLSGQNIEAVIVPSLGRLMDLRRPGETQGVLWQNPELLGQYGRSNTNTWTNFGGDKTWPAPESVWLKNAAGQWMPPIIFDQVPLKAQPGPDGLLLTSPIDLRTGVYFTRYFRIFANRLEVTTTYYKVTGDPVDISVWVITQLRDPEVVGTYANREAPYYTEFFGPTPRVQIEGKLLFWDRKKAIPAKIGTAGRRLVWVGKQRTLTIELQVDREGAPSPDRGSSAELYTSPDAQPYIELETLGPLVKLKNKQSVQTTNIYYLGDRLPDESPKDAVYRLLKP